MLMDAGLCGSRLAAWSVCGGYIGVDGRWFVLW